MPVAMGLRSTSVLAIASTSRAGFIDEIKGQTMAPTPTAAKAVALSVRKSRLVACGAPAGGALDWVAISAIEFRSLHHQHQERAGHLKGRAPEGPSASTLPGLSRCTAYKGSICGVTTGRAGSKREENEQST
jgi:hypothetical protein